MLCTFESEARFNDQPIPPDRIVLQGATDRVAGAVVSDWESRLV